MKHLLIKQAIVIPLAAMLVPILIAFSLPGYSSISQHISEVALLDHPIALIQRAAAFLTGLSIILFGVGLYLSAPRRFGFTALAALVAGSAMASNGVFVMGSPLHGLYGLGWFMVLVPALFAAEIDPIGANDLIKKMSLLAALLTLVYLWTMLAGFDPHGFHGLTQRLATLIIFGWYSVAGYWLVHKDAGTFQTFAKEAMS